VEARSRVRGNRARQFETAE